MTLDLLTEDNDDLSVLWDELRQRDPRVTLEGALRSDRRVITIGADQRKALVRISQHLLDSERAIPLELSAAHQRWPVGSLEEVLVATIQTWRTALDPGSGPPVWAFTHSLLHATRAGTVARLRAFKDPLTRHLAALHGRTFEPGSSCGPVFATNTLLSWLRGEAENWGPQELELLGLDRNAWTVETMAPADVSRVHRFRRMVRMFLLGEVYGLFDRAVVYLGNLDALIRTPMKTALERRIEAESLDTLLTELEDWKERTAVKVVIGWSGRDEDAKLLRGLHEPLFEKVQASQVFVTHA